MEIFEITGTISRCNNKRRTIPYQQTGGRLCEMLPIGGQISRRAVESTLGVLGDSASKLILMHLIEKFGSVEYLDAKAMSDCLEAYFGVDCTALLMRGMQLGTFCKKEVVA